MTVEDEGGISSAGATIGCRGFDGIVSVDVADQYYRRCFPVNSNTQLQYCRLNYHEIDHRCGSI